MPREENVSAGFIIVEIEWASDCYHPSHENLERIFTVKYTRGFHVYLAVREHDGEPIGNVVPLYEKPKHARTSGHPLFLIVQAVGNDKQMAVDKDANF